MKPRFRAPGVLCFALLIAGVLAAGQQPPAQQPPPVFRGGIRLVRVDVSVTEQNGRAVDDLRIADFEVTEDGVRQKVETVQFVRLDGQLAPGDDTSLDIRSPEHAEAEAAREDVRLFALFLDEYHIDKGPAVTQPLRHALTAFIEGLQPTDLAVLMDPLTPLSALEFTRSKPDLLEVIRRFEGRRGEFFPFRSAAEEAQARAGDVNRLRAQVTLSALTALVTRLGGLREGRKTVLFVSQGPPLSFRGIDLRNEIRQVTDAANRANVTIHAFDPRGLGRGTRFGADSLHALTGETGGRLIVNANRPEQDLERVCDDASAYYLLGYTPTRAEDDGRFHKIEVRVKRPRVRVLARKGYWAPDRKEVERAMMLANAPGDRALQAALGLLEQSTERRSVDVWTGVSLGPAGLTNVTVTWERREGAGVPAFTGVDLEVLRAGSRAPVEPPTTLPPASSGPAGGPRLTLALEPGPVLLRFTAHTADREIADLWEQPLLVPDLASPALAMATPRVFRARSMLELRALEAATAPVPSPVRRFRRTDRVLVELECYGTPSGAPLDLSAALLGADGRELRPLSLPALDAGRARLELPVVGLAQGTYVLRVRAALGPTQVEELVAFRVIAS